MEHLRIFASTFPGALARCFWGRNLVFHAAAIALTFLSVTLGFDWAYYTATRDTILATYLFPAVLLGFFVPVFLPVALLLWGAARDSARTITVALAATQAGMIGLLVSWFYKAFTGRAHPVRAATGQLADISHQFHFGFLDGGVFWGWPSSHTTVAFALAVTLICLFPKNRLVQILAGLFAFYVGLGVSMSIHWFSDFLAGAIFGTMAGLVVGRGFQTIIR